MNRHARVGWLRSLRTQILAGAVLMLGATVASVGYALIVHQDDTLTSEMERTVILQARNVALSSEKPLLRADPEFELFPLVRRLIEESPDITSVVITNADGIVQGHRDLVRVGKPFRPDFRGYTRDEPGNLAPGEQFYSGPAGFEFVTPVRSADRLVGRVYLNYSRDRLTAGIRSATRITIQMSAAALLLGLALSLILFRHISGPVTVMMRGVSALGHGQLGARIDIHSKNEFGVLAGAFNEMSGRLETAREELIVKERMDRELELAAEIQQSLIPAHTRLPEGIEIAHSYHAASQVGGDYVDVIEMPHTRVGIVMADVAGKGVPGLVVMAMVKILAGQLYATETSPSKILRRINASLHQNIRRNLFVTMFAGVYDVGTSTLLFSNAGHNPLFVYGASGDATRSFRMDGVPLGPFAPAQFDDTVREYEIELAPGDLVLQYTDGLNESRAQRGDVFGFDRIRNHVARYAGSGPTALVDHLVASERRFRGNAPQADDITLLALRAMASTPAEEPVA